MPAGPGNAVQNLSFTFNTLGNLTQRVDAVTQTTDDLTYDGLNRLTQAVTSNPSLPLNVTKTVSYNAIGNIITKSDVGNYTYDPARVHAVAGIAPGATGTVTASYAYDANGNMLTGRGRTVTWTSFDMVDAITQGTNAVAFTYDSEHARLKQVSSDGSTKYYLNDPTSGAMAEKIVGASLSVTWNDYIMLGAEMVALHVTAATPQTRYFHKDHLGSIVALTDESGAAVERSSFDAWGQRRTPMGEDDPLYPGQSITSQITRGFTGHEQLDSVGLVHMNGRIYEPVIGKMMSADPTVPNPMDGQSYNRYAYVANNPLSLTDPTGFYDVDPDHPGRMGDPLGRDQPGNHESGSKGISDADPVGDVTSGAAPPRKPGDLQLACGPACAAPVVIGIEIVKELIGLVTIGVLTVLGGDEEQKDATTTNQNPATPGDAGTAGNTETGEAVAPGSTSSEVNPSNPAAPQTGNAETPDYVGNNPRESKTNVKTDLPGGEEAAKEKFNEITGGSTNVDPKTGHLVGENGERLRIGEDGRHRIDIPAHDGLKHETIHFDP